MIFGKVHFENFNWMFQNYNYELDNKALALATI